MAEKERATREIELAAKSFRESGDAQLWLASSDPIIAKVSSCVNGPLAEMLAALTQHSDPSVCDYFRHGAPIIGQLPRSGCEEFLEYPQTSSSVDELRQREDL